MAMQQYAFLLLVAVLGAEAARKLTRRHKAREHMNATSGDYLVFLEVYSIGSLSSSSAVPVLEGEEAPEGFDEVGGQDAGGGGLFELYHSEFTICPSSGFAGSGLARLQAWKGSDRYHLLPTWWWESHDNDCKLLAYGGSRNSDQCSGIILRDQKISARYSPIRTAKLDRAWKYFYGFSDLSAEALKGRMCEGGCGANWAGASYNPLTNNCNTMTATGLECIMGLSGKLPKLGVSTGLGPKCSICPA